MYGLKFPLHLFFILTVLIIWIKTKYLIFLLLWVFASWKPANFIHLFLLSAIQELLLIVFCCIVYSLHMWTLLRKWWGIVLLHLVMKDLIVERDLWREVCYCWQIICILEIDFRKVSVCVCEGLRGMMTREDFILKSYGGRIMAITKYKMIIFGKQ